MSDVKDITLNASPCVCEMWSKPHHHTDTDDIIEWDDLIKAIERGAVNVGAVGVTMKDRNRRD